MHSSTIVTFIKRCIRGVALILLGGILLLAIMMKFLTRYESASQVQLHSEDIILEP
jgi:hypothetical protein